MCSCSERWCHDTSSVYSFHYQLRSSNIPFSLVHLVCHSPVIRTPFLSQKRTALVSKPHRPLASICLLRQAYLTCSGAQVHGLQLVRGGNERHGLCSETRWNILPCETHGFEVLLCQFVVVVLPTEDTGRFDSIELRVFGHVGLARKAGTANEATTVGSFVAFSTIRLTTRQ